MWKPPNGRFEELWLPIFPLASDDLRNGVYRTSREKALNRLYIEANPLAISNLLVVDVDHEDALLRSVWDKDGWRPNAVVENPLNGHAHAIWALKEPFTRTEYAKRKPIAYAAAVTEGLRRAVDGDQGYSGLLTKNPEHEAWASYWIENDLYSLDKLAFHLDECGLMPSKSWRKTRRKNPVGLGRNCAIFETARTWAYREVRHHFGDPQGLETAIHACVHDINSTYSAPLPHQEATHIAASITRWILTKSRMWRDGAAVYEATFVATQAARGIRSGEARRAEKQQLVLNLIEEQSS